MITPILIGAGVLLIIEAGKVVTARGLATSPASPRPTNSYPESGLAGDDNAEPDDSQLHGGKSPMPPRIFHRELIDDASGIDELRKADAAARRPYAKVRLVEGLISLAVVGAMAIGTIEGCHWLWLYWTR